MTEKEAIKAFDALQSEFDNEDAHKKADRVLLEVLRNNGFEKVADAWGKVNEDFGGFYYA